MAQPLLGLGDAQKRSSDDYRNMFNSIESQEPTIERVYSKSTQNRLRNHERRFEDFCKEKLRLSKSEFSLGAILSYLQFGQDNGLSFQTINTN